MSEFPEVHAGRAIGFPMRTTATPRRVMTRYWIQQLLQPSATSLDVQQNNQDQVLRFNQLTPETCFFGYRGRKERRRWGCARECQETENGAPRIALLAGAVERRLCVCVCILDLGS